MNEFCHKCDNTGKVGDGCCQCLLGVRLSRSLAVQAHEFCEAARSMNGALPTVKQAAENLRKFDKAMSKIKLKETKTNDN